MNLVERMAKNPTAYGISRTRNLTLAKKWAVEGAYWTSVLLGEDGLFWVPSNNKDASSLIKAGYSVL